MKRNIILILGLVGLLFSCTEKENSNPKNKVLEKKEYFGFYSAMDDKEAYSDSLKNITYIMDTVYHDSLQVTYTKRVDSVFIFSKVSSYKFRTTNNGSSGEYKEYWSSLCNSRMRFSKSDSGLILNGTGSCGATHSFKNFNGYNL